MHQRRLRQQRIMALMFLLARSLFFHCIVYIGQIFSRDMQLISEWCMSSVQSVMTMAARTIIESLTTDIMTHRQWLTNTYASFALPYFIHNILAMFQKCYCAEGCRHIYKLSFTFQYLFSR